MNTHTKERATSLIKQSVGDLKSTLAHERDLNVLKCALELARLPGIPGSGRAAAARLIESRIQKLTKKEGAS